MGSLKTSVQRLREFFRDRNSLHIGEPGYQPPPVFTDEIDDHPRVTLLGASATAIAVFSLLACVVGFVDRHGHEFSPYARGHQFKEDNASGATANAAQLIQDAVESIPWFLYFLLASVVASLERVRAGIVWQGKILLNATHRKTSRSTPQPAGDAVSR